MKPHEPAWLDLADANLFQAVYFLYLDWPSGPIRVHTYVGDIEVDGETWRGIGLVGSIEMNGAASVAQKPVLTLKLSDVPGDAAGFMTPDGAEGSIAKVYIGAKDPERESLNLIGGIHPEFIGRVGDINMNFEEVGEDGVRRFSYAVDVEVGRSPRIPLTYYHSDADQRRRTAGDTDTALKYLAAAFAEPVVWTPS